MGHRARNGYATGLESLAGIVIVVTASPIGAAQEWDDCL